MKVADAHNPLNILSTFPPNPPARALLTGGYGRVWSSREKCATLVLAAGNLVRDESGVLAEVVRQFCGSSVWFWTSQVWREAGSGTFCFYLFICPGSLFRLLPTRIEPQNAAVSKTHPWEAHASWLNMTNSFLCSLVEPQFFGVRDKQRT